ncbi:MAG: DKNYY domain-containing protein [Methylophilaceae bacterium]
MVLLNILDGKLFLNREFEHSVLDKTLPSYDPNNPYSWNFNKVVDYYNNEINISINGFKIIVEGSSSIFYYTAWIMNEDGVYFISIHRKTNTPILKKVAIKKEAFDEVILIDEDFIKTKSGVFYTGKKIREADAETFEKVEHTQFYTDKNFVYSYTLTDGLAKIEMNPTDRFFIPFCWWFADKENIYQQSSWTNKIEAIDGNLSATRSNVSTVLNENIWKAQNDLDNPDNEQKRQTLFAEMKTYNDVFKLFFPTAKAKWNNQ